MTKEKNQNRLDRDIDSVLVCRSVNMSSDRAVENLALKMLELKKRLGVASNER